MHVCKHWSVCSHKITKQAMTAPFGVKISVFLCKYPLMLNYIHICMFIYTYAYAYMSECVLNSESDATTSTSKLGQRIQFFFWKKITCLHVIAKLREIGCAMQPYK